MNVTDFEQLSRTALQLLAERCPRLVAKCYWAGTAAIATEELHHRRSFDLDFHTQDAVLLAERLLAWTDEAIDADLDAYDDVSSRAAHGARDLLLAWLKDATSEESEG